MEFFHDVGGVFHGLRRVVLEDGVPQGLWIKDVQVVHKAGGVLTTQVESDVGGDLFELVLVVRTALESGRVFFDEPVKVLITESVAHVVAPC